MRERRLFLGQVSAAVLGLLLPPGLGPGTAGKNPGPPGIEVWRGGQLVVCRLYDIAEGEFFRGRWREDLWYQAADANPSIAADGFWERLAHGQPEGFQPWRSGR